jgi:membrane-associated HD superfamily phosphohydrolase
VIDAVTQHQGTSLLRTFYHKALEQSRQTGAHVIEGDYRYPGPRPQTREAGIMMLGDTVEAATRALKNPSPADVKERVAKVIQERMADDQLGDCALTLGDLAKVEEAFTRVLILGVYHSRIEYPAVKQEPGNPVETIPRHEHRDRDSNPRFGVVDRSS